MSSGSTSPSLSNNYKTWDVRLIWNVTYESVLFGAGGTPTSFQVFGVDRSSITINRPLTRNNSLDEQAQGYTEGLVDVRVTIFTKESGITFEEMRRLAASKIPFDVSLTLAGAGFDNAMEGIWIDGYEEFLGCRVVAERTNYNVAEFPVREFECMVLRHRIMSNTLFAEMIEGDGTQAQTIGP